MIIATCAPAAEQIAANELKLLDPESKLIKRISQGVCLFKNCNNNFFDILKKQPPIFIRHLMPVDLAFQKCGESDMLKALNPLFVQMDKNKPFSVQTRIFSQSLNEPTPFLVNSAVSEYLTQRGFSVNIKNPAQIISVVATEDNVYAGLSTPLENMSKWAGGALSFSKDDSFISRAEFKLLEALEVFGIELKPGQNALDLGAAPGGWSKVLLNGGLNVTAVDPACLSSLLSGKVTHIKSTAQQFFRNEATNKFNVITNDMKIDAGDAINILFEAKKHLSCGGIIITTLKLPEKNQQKTASRAIRSLSSQFEIAGARQLFHNRSEICVVCRKKNEAQV